jgi:orotidine-5'-phosphate decarboxylase
VSFGARLADAFDTRGHLCVGIDPHAFLLQEWGLTDDAAGVREFGLRVVDATSGRAAIVKPQVAFFERHGSAGFAALEVVLAAARDAGLLVIGDAKRGDIGSTFDGYAEAWLTPGSPLEVDALTVSPFLGIGSIEGPRGLALENGKGLFVLAATSNPEAAGLQLARESSGLSVAASIVERVHDWNSDATRLGDVGLVIGATLDVSAYEIADEHLVATPILAPGFGSQGARFADIRDIFGAASGNVVVSASRSILAAGPDEIAHAISSQVAEVAGAFAA